MIHGNIRSLAAQEAEAQGKYPLTRAIETIYKSLDCKNHKISRRKVREFLQNKCCCGWHHVAGPNGAREVEYYETSLTEDQKRELLAGGD
jgi:hypothetical protein